MFARNGLGWLLYAPMKRILGFVHIQTIAIESNRFPSHVIAVPGKQKKRSLVFPSIF